MEGVEELELDLLIVVERGGGVFAQNNASSTCVCGPVGVDRGSEKTEKPAARIRRVGASLLIII